MVPSTRQPVPTGNVRAHQPKRSMPMVQLRILLLAAFCCGPLNAADPSSFAITDVRLFDGAAVHERATVVVTGEIITAVYTGAVPDLADDITLIDGIGYTLLPGLIDSHVHVWEEKYLSEPPRFGVTTVLDMAFPDPKPANALQATRGKPEYAHYADYYSAVISPTTPGGHGTEPEVGMEYPLIRYPYEADEFIAARVAEGSDYIKITLETGLPFRPLTWVPPSTLKAMIEATHRNDMLVVAHITDPDIALFAIESGIDGLVHIWGPRVNGAARPDIAAAARRAGTFFVPTLTVYEHVYGTATGGQSLVDDPDIGPRLGEEAIKTLTTQYPPETRYDRLLLSPSAEAEIAWKMIVAATRSLYDGDVRLLAGTDPANLGTWYGPSMHREMELLVDQVGMQPVEVLTAATSAVADSFRLYDRGYITPGLRADMFLVQGNPTVRIKDSRKIARVWKAGTALQSDWLYE